MFRPRPLCAVLDLFLLLSHCNGRLFVFEQVVDLRVLD